MWLKKAVVRGEGLRDFFFWYVVRSSLSDCTLRFLYQARKRAVCGDEDEELCRIWIYPEEHAKWSVRVAEARDARTGEGGQETGQIQWDARRSLTWMKGGRKTRDAFLGGRMDWVPLGRGRMGRGFASAHTLAQSSWRQISVTGCSEHKKN